MLEGLWSRWKSPSELTLMLPSADSSSRPMSLLWMGSNHDHATMVGPEEGVYVNGEDWKDGEGGDNC